MGSAPTTTTTQSGTSTTAPYAPAQPYLQNILNTISQDYTGFSPGEQSGLNSIIKSAGQVPQFGPQGKQLTSNLFNYNTQPQQNMINLGYGQLNSILPKAYGQLQNTLGPAQGNLEGMLNPAYQSLTSTLSPEMSQSWLNPQNNPYLSPTLNALGQQAEQATNSLFAASGRDPAGNAQAAKAGATAMTNAEAPYLLNQFNTGVAQQQGATNQMINAALGVGGTELTSRLGIGNSLLGGGLATGEGLLGGAGTAAQGLTGQQLGQFGVNTQGISTAEGLPGLYTTPGQAQWQAGQMQAFAPLANLPGLESIINPIAGMGGTSVNLGTGNTQYPQSTFGNILGGALGANALLGGSGMFGNSGALSGLGGLFGGGGEFTAMDAAGPLALGLL